MCSDFNFTCTGEIFVPHATRAFDMKCPLAAFRRDVDESVPVEGCRCDPEDVLLLNPRYEKVGDFVEQLHSSRNKKGQAQLGRSSGPTEAREEPTYVGRPKGDLGKGQVGSSFRCIFFSDRTHR